jgi:hypothetical protein
MIVAENRCRFFRSCANGTLQLMLMTAMRRAALFGRENALLNFAARIAALLPCSLVLATSANFTTPCRMPAQTRRWGMGAKARMKIS